MNGESGSAIWLSLEVGIWVVLFGVPLAVWAGYLLSRAGYWPRTLIGAVVLLPLVLPPVVTGLVLLRLLGSNGVGGWLGIQVPFTFVSAVLAALVVGLPLAVISARQAFEAVDPGLREVSLTLGAPPRRTFLRVLLPLSLPGILAGAVLLFGRSLGEFGATIVVAGNTANETRTIPLAIYTWLQSFDRDSEVLFLAVVSAVIGLLALICVERLRPTSGGRR